MKTKTVKGQEIAMRWMIRRDLDEVLAIEREAFRFPWGERHLLGALADRSTIAKVAEHGDRIVGYCVYTLLEGGIDIINLAVCPYCRRQGVGTAFVRDLLGKLDERRSVLQAGVGERNLGGQLFFRAMGMECVTILKDVYDVDDNRDAYLFRHERK